MFCLSGFGSCLFFVWVRLELRCHVEIRVRDVDLCFASRFCFVMFWFVVAYFYA